MRNKIITWLMRALVGVTFIISGFVKAIDPWGTFYKIQDYIGVFGWNITSNIVITGVFALCTYEFCVGIFTLLGCYRKSVPFGALLLMLFMLPLTLWIALTDPVADCGCFGDAFIISNWATFWKNILLTLAIIWLIKFNKSCICLIRPYIQWLALISSVLFIVVIGLVGYIYQPLIDFRPFPIGSIIHNPTNSTIEKEDKEKEGSDSDFDSDAEENDPDEMIFIYSKDGGEHQFTLDDELPDEADGWKFVRRENVVNKDNTPFLSDKSNVDKSLEDSTIQVWSEDGDEELTDNVFLQQGRQILLLMPDLKTVSMAETWKINSLYQWATDNDINLIGIVSGNIEQIENWKDISLAEYPLYTADDTQIKMLARGNPAIVFLRDGKIMWKSSLRALFTDDFQANPTSNDPSHFFIDNEKLLWRIIYTYLLIIGVMMFLSLLPIIARFLPAALENSIKKRNEKINYAERRMEERIEHGKNSILKEHRNKIQSNQKGMK